MSLADVQLGLRTGGAYAEQAVGIERADVRPGDPAGHFGGLIKTPLPQALRVQWHGHQQIAGRQVGMPGQGLTQPAGDGQLMTILQRLNDAVDGKFIAKKTEGAVEMRRMALAVAAGSALRCWLGALQANTGRKSGQLRCAGWAQQGAAGVFATQQTTAGEKVIEQLRQERGRQRETCMESRGKIDSQAAAFDNS